jgi:transcriptional regulator with XRE-family HTH domain
MIPQREKEIGARLRAFRESLQIPRSRFAVSIGFGSERIASYEAGRAPLPYGVFKAVSNRYHINAQWLSTGQGSPSAYAPLDDANFEKKLSPRALFSNTYDEFLTTRVQTRVDEARLWASRLNEQLAWACESIKHFSPEEPLRSIVEEYCEALEALIKKMREDLKLRRKVETKLRAVKK